MNRKLSLSDLIICHADRALRTLTPNTQIVTRKSPAANVENSEEFAESEAKKIAGLMRVNHTGEVCAQALYQGQAITAKLEKTRDAMEHAADEEIDHLAWCESRLNELNSHTSVLNPIWYSLSFGMGAAAGLISDKVSLGFVAATEELVSEHLESHIEKLPEQDLKSRAVLHQMLEDEQNHGHAALAAGGAKFPAPVKSLMRFVSKTMTKSSYYV